VASLPLMNIHTGQEAQYYLAQAAKHIPSPVFGYKNHWPVHGCVMSNTGNAMRRKRAGDKTDYMIQALTSGLEKGVDVWYFVLDQLAWTTAMNLVGWRKLLALKCR